MNAAPPPSPVAAAPGDPAAAVVQPAAPGAPVPARRRPPAPRETRHSPLSLVDEAAHRLRLAPAATLGIYYAGTLPFVLALLFFCADMGRSADAAERSTGFALGLAGLFIVMKTCQAVFASRLRAQFARRPPVAWTWRRVARVVFVQTVWQSTGLFLLQVAGTLILPLGWVYAFYQNVTVYGDGETADGGRVFGRAWRGMWLWPKQNHAALSVLSGLGFFVWLNLMIAVLTLPQLLKIFTGEDNVFTRAGLALFNSTFFAVSFALVYLALDPLIKTFYALRCFYADATLTGEDLLAELRALPPVEGAADAPGTAPAPSAPAASDPSRRPAGTWRAWLLPALLAAVFAASAPAAADAPPPAPAPAPAPAHRAGVSPDAVDRSVRDVLNRREFTWRGPRPPETPRDDKPGAVATFIKSVLEKAKSWYRTFRDWFPWKPKDSGQKPSDGNSGSGGFAPPDLRPIIYAVVALCVAAGLFLVYKSWRARRSARELAGRAAPEVASAALPDLTDEDVLADQLPEDEWLLLARSLLARGEHRLALRAFYLSVLAHLGTRGLLGIARHKSNRDYLGELRRRARDRVGLPDTFGRLVARFERVWYGSHPADDPLLAEFQADRARLLADTPAPAPRVPAVPA